jgi:D-alanyl-D-alanine carboxypeptidase
MIFQFKKIALMVTAMTSFLIIGGVNAQLADSIYPVFPQEILSIESYDFNGKTARGDIVVNANTREAVQALFKDLYASGFFLERVVPMGDQVDHFEAALKAHQTFSFGLERAADKSNGLKSTLAYAIAINPLSNPVLSRSLLHPYPKSDKLRVPLHDSLMHAVPTTSTAPEVVPFDAVLALNGARNSLPGRITPEVESIFNRHGFARYLGTADRAYFGVFVYVGKEKSLIKQAATASSMTTRAASGSSVHRIERAAPAVISPLSAQMRASLMKSGAWKKGCPVSLDRLNVIEFSYLNKLGDTYRGSIIAADILAPSLVNITQALYSQGFPLEHPAAAGAPKDPLHFGGTGAFNCRAITGGGGYSLHSYGTAIDINFGINPYIGGYAINLPDRMTHAQEIVPGDADLRLFIRSKTDAIGDGYAESIKALMHQNGYIVWGGDWSNRTDYMHFQTTAFLSYLFPSINKETGLGLLQLSVKYPLQFHRLDADIYVTDLKKWILLYELYPQDFLKSWQKHLPHFEPQMSTDDFLLMLYKDLNRKN